MVAWLLCASGPAAAQTGDTAGSEDPIAVEEEAPQDEPEREVLLPAPSSDIEVFLVTASQRDHLLQDIPISATTFSAAELKSLRVQNIADLADYTPNLEINTAFAASNPTLFIRGIGLKDYNANAAGAVSVYQDGININAGAIQLGQLFDVETVEVLRGPQGSVNGRNATAGAIMISSVLPDGEFDASGSFTYGNYDNLQAEGAVSLPLHETLSARLAFTANFRDGTMDNQCADHDPEEYDQPVLSEANIRQVWEDRGRPTTTRNGQPIDRFPAGSNRLPDNKPGNVDTQNRELRPDGICIWREAGFLDIANFNGVGDPSWFSFQETDQSRRNVEDFQGLKRELNDVANWAGRAVLRFQPDLGMDWVVNLHGNQNRSDSRHLQMLRADYLLDPGAYTENVASFSEAVAAQNSGREGVKEVHGLFDRKSQASNLIPGGRRGDDPDSGFFDMDGDENLDSWGVSHRGFWEIGNVVVTSLGGYEWYDRFVEDDGDASPLSVLTAEYDDTAWQLSEELRVESEGESHRWSVGAFFLHEQLEAGNLFPGILFRRIEQTFDQKLTSIAPYANGRYDFTESLSVNLGVRYNWERKDFALTSSVNNLEDPNAESKQFDETDDEVWTGVTGDATLAWAPDFDWFDAARIDSQNFYAKYGRGMKGGHFNAGLTIQADVLDPQRITAVDPEFIHSVEIGWKSRWLEDRLSLNIAAFRYWYKDLQVFDIDNQKGELPIQQLLNGDARVWGAEVEIAATPLPGLSIQSGFGWLDAEFVSFKVEKFISQRRGGQNQEPEKLKYSGHSLIAAPRFSFSGITQYEIPLFGWGTLVPQYDFSYRSKVYLDPQEIDPVSQDGYWVHNARLALRSPDGRIEVAGWVENLTDERYKIDVFDLTIEFNTILEVWSDPRTYGVTVSYAW
jgi:outer membrane receptor protein involved in Fe transport